MIIRSLSENSEGWPYNKVWLYIYFLKEEVLPITDDEKEESEESDLDKHESESEDDEQGIFLSLIFSQF